MQLTPRYDDPSFFRLELAVGDPAVPLVRQRTRLATLLGFLDDEQWAAPTRCEGWSVQDVIAHLVGTNQFWAFSMAAALGGEPTKFLTTFDPVRSPEQLVEPTRSQKPAKILESFVETTDALAGAVSGLDDDAWSTLGEAPPGHVPLRAVALHALWDSWIHERDIALPLGLDPTEEPDEIISSLHYAAALSPAFVVAGGSSRPGAIAVEAKDPDTSFVIEVGAGIVVRAGEAPDDALSLTGSAVDLVEALSFRVPLPCVIPDEHRWLMRGLADVFDRD
jgi:uncharacterized protein (TIGR03083 family)